MITNSVPTTLRQPGSKVEFDITSGARGLLALTRRLALIGVKGSAGTATVATPYQVFTDGDADSLFGKGSELALMCRAALAAGRMAGKMAELWAVAVAAPSGAATTKTLTVTGPATQAGNVAFRIAGRTIFAPVGIGDTADTVAASIKAAIDVLAGQGVLPGTATVTTNVVTFTLAQLGINGEDLKVSIDSKPTGVGVVAAAGATGSGVYDITASLDALRDKHYNAVAVANHASTDVSDLASYEDERSGNGVKKWSFGFIGSNGTLSSATTLASAANKEYTTVVSFEDCPNLPGEIAAVVAMTRFAEEDPSMTMSDVEVPLYAPPPTSIYTEGLGGEIESALAGGVTPLSVTADGRVFIVRLVTTKTTHGGAPYDMLRDFNVAYTLTWVGEQADAVVKLYMSVRANRKMADAPKRVRSKLLQMLRAAEKRQIVQNVEAHKGEVQVEPDASVPSRLNYDIPVSVVPGLEQVAGKLRLFLENALAA